MARWQSGDYRTKQRLAQDRARMVGPFLS